MKKIIITMLACVAMLCFAACDVQINTDVQKLNCAGEFEHNGHEYIMFSVSMHGSSHHGCVHDPDCKKCKRKL